MWLALAFGAVLVAIVLAVCILLLFPRRRKVGGDRRLRVAFVHPDLGIGGAERLVVDAAVALQKEGHEVIVHTARHESGHCFEETRDGTLSVVVYGDFLPRRVLGRFYAACAYLRMCWVSFRIVLSSILSPFDVMFVDQVSICLPILQLASPRGIVFYCHYPDYLLTGRSSLIKRLYRAPLDFLEEKTTGMADVVFVNSKFTAGVFAEAFPSLAARGLVPDVLYPPLNLVEQDRVMLQAQGAFKPLGPTEQLLVSINRFEEKKNIGLAIRTFAALPEESRRLSRLVVAGGYDERLPENVRHAAALQQLAEELGVSDRVLQMRSISAEVKATLLRHAACLLYTPDREHFGIVPVEAMYARVPVLAVNSGGPLESIAEGQTGFLRPPEPAEWASVVEMLLKDRELQKRLGAAGRSRVEERFSLAAFQASLNKTVQRLSAADGSAATDNKKER